VILTDTIATHPKILRAGALLGERRAGRARVLSLYVAAIGYARHYLTDGFIPDAFVRSNPVCSRGEVVAKALSAPSVRLWERTRRGYRIHDFGVFNETADQIRAKRVKHREQVAAYRARKKAGD
jgi:hypothetical protein